jgi:hypothetical protein
MRYGLIISFLLTASLSNAQVFLKAVLNNSYSDKKAGDTLILSGAYEDPGTQKLYYYLKENETKIPAEEVALVLNSVDFWDVQQFYYTSHEINSSGWNLNSRNQLEQKTLDLMAQLEAEKKLYADKFVEDYLQQLIQKIHYPKIWKGRDQNIQVKILNSDQKVCYAFDNGIILISTQLLANLTNERDLFKILTEAVGHILLNTNFDNVNPNASTTYEQLGAIYPENAKKRMQIIANKFINYYEKRNGTNAFAGELDFLDAMAGIISYTAWQEYYNNHFQLALEYIDRLMKSDIANSTDYLLKAKLYTKMVNTPEVNEQAIAYLKTAASFKDQQLPEIYSDMGVLQLREKQYSEARDTFTEYYKLVSQIQDDEKMKWALKMVNLCDIQLKENQTGSTP